MIDENQIKDDEDLKITKMDRDTSKNYNKINNINLINLNNSKIVKFFINKKTNNTNLFLKDDIYSSNNRTNIENESKCSSKADKIQVVKGNGKFNKNSNETNLIETNPPCNLNIIKRYKAGSLRE